MLINKMIAVGVAGFMLVTSFSSAFAAIQKETNNTDVANDLANADIIDTEKTGSISIYKYDITAASQAGVFEEGDVTSTGKADSALQKTLYDYAVAGVEFSYLKAGNIEQYSYTTGTGSELKLVYEVPAQLAAILGLKESDAVVMTGSGVSAPCANTGVYHYTSQQINDALAAVLSADDVAAKNALESYIRENAGTSAMPLTDAKGYTTATDLSVGLYLVVETKVPENITDTTDPWFVSVPMTNLTADAGHEYDAENDGGSYWFYDITCYPKNQSGNPTLDKLVRNATGEAAETAGEPEDYSYLVYNQDNFSAYGYGNEGKDATDAEYAAARGDAQYATTKGGIDAADNDGTTDADGTKAAADSGNEFASTLKSAETVSGEYQYASTTTASEGDVLDYILVSRLPHITSTSTFLSQYTFADTLSAGLTYNEDVKIAFYTNAEDAYINNTANAEEIWNLNITDDWGNVTDEAKYAQAYQENVKTGETRLTVTMTEKGLSLINGDNSKNGSSYSDYYMVVYYTVTVNSDASVVLGDEGNPNDVTLTWQRTSEGYYDTLEDECYVYSYGLDLTKTFSDGKGDAAEVQFVLYNRTDGYYVTAEQAEAGIYYVTGKTAEENEATVFSPSAEGSLKIYGLEGDVYALTEIHTDNGYSLLADPLVIDIKTASRSIQAAVAGWTGLTGYNEGQQNGKIAMFVGEVVSGSAAVDGITAAMLADEDSDNAIVKLAVLNSAGFLLPQTGGAGLYLVTILGVAAVAAGCFFACRKPKKKED